MNFSLWAGRVLFLFLWAIFKISLLNAGLLFLQRNKLKKSTEEVFGIVADPGISGAMSKSHGR